MLVRGIPFFRIDLIHLDRVSELATAVTAHPTGASADREYTAHVAFSSVRTSATIRVIQQKKHCIAMAEPAMAS